MSAFTFGPVFTERADGVAIRAQIERVRNKLLSAAMRGRWLTVEEICKDLERDWGFRFPQTSVDADLRHLRKPQFGSYNVIRRGREGTRISEYRIFVRASQANLF